MKLPAYVNKKNLLSGLKTLSRLWKRGLVPDDLERYYMLYWFLSCGGNILATARRLKIHRNTIQGYFHRFQYSKKAVKLRYAWQRMIQRFPHRSESELFHAFYRRFGSKPYISSPDTHGIVLLWKTGFPLKVLKAHYLLWASRSNHTRTWIESKLGYSNRHQLRIFSQIGNPHSRENFWLKPMQPQQDEWYLRRYH